LKAHIDAVELALMAVVISRKNKMEWTEREGKSAGGKKKWECGKKNE
jgi:hypothetical protein